MLFNSHVYLIFLVVAVLVISLVRPRFRVYLLGLFSLAFYAFWRWDFAFLVVFSAAIDFVASKYIHRSKSRINRKLLLFLSLATNLGLLLFFKYTNFLFENIIFFGQISGVAESNHYSAIDIILPLGISFYTFQTISYTIDVYRGVVAPTRNFFVFLTFVSFWPQLIAGPILRAGEVIPQLEKPVLPTRELFVSGINRIIIGLFKKVILADNLAIVVDNLFARDINNISQVSANEIWLAAFLFGFQIYLDFSAYSDIAIGSARLVGVKFPENFNFPYLARSPRDFWARWHISLSSWIRDYLYLPLLGKASHNRSSGGIVRDLDEQTGRRSWALLLTWVIMGLWHGANWTFFLWGLYHAFIILGYRILCRINLFSISVIQANRFTSKAQAVLGWGITLFLMMGGWIFFRADSVGKALAMIERIVTPSAYLLYPTSNIPDYLTALGLMFGMLIASKAKLHWVQFSHNQATTLIKAVEIIWYAILIGFILLFLKPAKQFIYFQF